MSVNASTLRHDKRIHGLLVGPSGVGKTGAAMSFPGRVVDLDFDDRGKGPALGCEFLQEKVKRGEIEIERIMPYRGKSVVTLKDVYTILEVLDSRVAKGEIDTVILDSTTSMKRFFVNDSVNHELKTSGKAGSLAHFQIGEAILAQKQDHNYAATCMLNVIYDNLKTFPCNVFVTTHIKDKVIASPTPEDPERTIVVGETITAPGQLAVEIPSWFDEVWEFQLDTTNHALPPKRKVIFQGKWARTSFRDLGTPGPNGTWNKTHVLDITNKSLYESLKPTLDRLANENTAVAK